MIKKPPTLTKKMVKARLKECSDLEVNKPDWVEMATRVLKKFINTAKLSLVMAMNDGIDSDDVLNMGDEDDVLERVQFAMWRTPSRTPLYLLSGKSEAGGATNLVLLTRFLTSHRLDMVIESVDGQMYVSLSTDSRLFAPSAVL